jgi:hypothetical protein
MAVPVCAGLAELAHNQRAGFRVERGAKEMATVTLEKALEQARSLPSDERRKLIETLTAEALPPQPLKSLEQLMAEQGTRPLKFEELLPAADIAPDESADEMVDWIYAQRRRDTHRSID